MTRRYHRGSSSVEYKVARALADKEGIAEKRLKAIEQEAERKRLKKEAEEKSKSKTSGMATSMAEEEEKYAGPLLNGSAPEMIVPSGALGMTNTKRKMQINYKKPAKKSAVEENVIEIEDDDEDDDKIVSSTSMISEANFRRAQMNPVVSERRHGNIVTLKDYINGDFELTSDILPPLNDVARPSDTSNSVDFTSPDFIVPRSAILDTMNRHSIEPVIDKLDESISSVIQNALSGAPFAVGEIIELDDDDEEEEDEADEPVDVDLLDVIESNSPEEDMDEESMEEQMMNMRYIEIGRRISEIELSDFKSGPFNSESAIIASRGEEILLTLRENLNVIREKLAEFAVGTIFDDIDALTCAFAGVSMEELNRVKQNAAEKQKNENTEGEAAPVDDEGEDVDEEA